MRYISCGAYGWAAAFFVFTSDGTVLLLPVFLILFALLFAAMLAYGTDPGWADYGRHGIELIVWSRRLEGPIVCLAIVFCLALLALVIANKRRAWWLVGLVPVLALFYHRVTQNPAEGLRCVQDLPMLGGSQVGIGEDDWVVGCQLDGQSCAIPYSTLSVNPVIVYAGREHTVVLFWSATANCAQAFFCSRDLRASDLEVICTIDNALVVFNSRLGEFINGVTGRTFKGEIPSGLNQPISLQKCTWHAWRTLYPDTKVMADKVGEAVGVQQPTKMMGNDFRDARKVCIVATTQPLAVPDEAITDRPLNLTSGQSSILLVRVNGMVQAFSRELPGELVPRFFSAVDSKHMSVVWGDSDTNSVWSGDGHWVAGLTELRREGLKPIVVEDELYWNVMKFWDPGLHLATDAELAGAVSSPVKVVGEKPAGRERSLPR